MGFSKMVFNPEKGLRDTTVYLQQPESEEALRGAIQDQSDQLKNYLNNTLLPALESSDTGSSGAAGIGSEAIAGVDGMTVQEKLAALKVLIDAISVSSSGLTENVVATRYLADLAVTAAKLADGAVETAKIADGAVMAGKLADGVVTQAKIEAEAIGAGQIASGAVSQTKIAAGAVTQAKIADSAVGAGQMADGAVTANKIAAGAVTAAKITAGAVTNDKLAYVYARVASDGSTALDNLITPGMWRLQTNSGLPYPSASYGNILVVRTPGADTIAQLIFDYGSSIIAWRSGSPPVVDGGGSWGAWHKIWHDGNGGIGSGLDADKIKGRNITVSTSAPASPAVNDIWIDIS